jgi:hypothetical protein
LSEIKWISGLEWSNHKVGYCPSVKAFREEFGDNHVWAFSSKDFTTGFAVTQNFFDSDKLQHFVLVYFNPDFAAIDENALKSTLVHESIHVFDLICETLGMEPCTETRAYITQHIYLELVKVVDPKDIVLQSKKRKVKDGKRLEAEEGGSGGIQQAQEDPGPS